jgi:(R,R)-butanediol dehydrogenase / meso-butanediol dehydrogenase / diacetyl reductase
MRALRWHDRQDVRVEEVAEPVVREHADALVAVSWCGICGTDLAEWRSGPGMIRTTPHPLSGQSVPVTLGHELVGTLVEGSSPDGTIGPGTRVTVDACLRCGVCPACVRGDYHRCRQGGSIGLHLDGGFAPLVAVPGYTLVAVPDAVTDEQAALTEPFAVALHGLERAAVQPGTDVLVLGFGTIGAASALVARAIGALPHVVELDDERRRTAERLGLPTLDPGDDLARRVRKQLGDGGADVVVESTGVAAMVPVAIECAARGGRVALLGLPSAPSTVDARRITLFERSLVGSLGYRHDLPRVLELVASGRLDPAELVSAKVPLAGADEVLRELASASAGRIKVLVDTAA